MLLQRCILISHPHEKNRSYLIHCFIVNNVIPDYLQKCTCCYFQSLLQHLYNKKVLFNRWPSLIFGRKEWRNSNNITFFYFFSLLPSECDFATNISTNLANIVICFRLISCVLYILVISQQHWNIWSGSSTNRQKL